MKQKLTKEEILKAKIQFLEKWEEYLYIDITKETQYLKECIEEYIESLDDNTVYKLLTEVNLDLDQYIFHIADDIYNKLLEIITKNIDKVLTLKFSLKEFPKLNIQFVKRPIINININSIVSLAQYDILSNTLLIPILNDEYKIDILSKKIFENPVYKDSIVHELTHFDDYENILSDYPEALFNNNLQKQNSKENGILEVNAFSRQLINVINKKIINNIQNKVIKNQNIDKNILINIIKETLEETKNSNNIQDKVLINIYNKLGQKNRKKVLKHLYIYLTEELLKAYPFLNIKMEK